ncbi:50S ribosomal protein L29 [Candidatus Bipolaricaulota bacterium]|jgi:large subunit ribosomal protein L29|nr:50S ribosomal protein L29 [Candidatus Bipolaricaulota bacterium]RLE31822.1 MAG: 50S ribosomal protein L29 [Candidatus Acetothermia bacterium]RLE33948.1 MAG: 50S ribosomal protein L29 [Candidatus Acetothermia bacterium]HDC92739.1 50S ribosomal protein L29 [Candidatus Acetothermia bacterium]
MKARELRELSDDELRQKVAEWKRKLLNLRFQLASGQLQNTAEIKKTKKDIARALTILRERELKRREGSRA